MSLQLVLIAEEWRQSHTPVGSFTAVNPATKTPLPEQHPISGPQDIQQTLQVA